MFGADIETELNSESLVYSSDEGRRYHLTSPTAMPAASTFLWNRRMLMQVNCRGFAVAQFMQPEPAKYAHAPGLEAKTFMQPEQAFYAHHPGRFFYIKNEQSGDLFSAPYEPVRAPLEHFDFSPGLADVSWQLARQGVRVQLSVRLPVEDVVELWQLSLSNTTDQPLSLSVYPYFPVGYMSWMHQAGEYRADLGGIVCSSVTPYQKVEDYFKNRHFKDSTFLLHELSPDAVPVAWEVAQAAFEGEGGLHNPDALQQPLLAGGDARYEVPAAVLQYRITLAPGETREFRFLFGPAQNTAEISQLRARYLSAQGFARAAQDYQAYLEQAQPSLSQSSPDHHLDRMVNHWLPRQMFYHGDVNRLSTDPQTRNYLQDNMGMVYLRPELARAAFLRALSQQKADGSMPDGILLVPGAELKYINQVPHTDHCVWLPVCLKPYLDETADDALLNVPVTDIEHGQTLTVFERISRAMDWLLQARDARGLSYIAQGDWCDPMNMVGYQGRGVSAWLSLATAYALNLWAEICTRRQQPQLADTYFAGARAINEAVNRHLWDGAWYGRGITDDGALFGVSRDPEGSIYLNPQAWALLSGAASSSQRAAMLTAVAQQLETPYGVAMLAPAYTAMREDIGRVTQKHPGSAENGSVYNHAAVFYIYSLYTQGLGERAWPLLRRMLPGPDRQDYIQRGQLPVFIPNYYRGAWRQYPRVAGRSSQLCNTGTLGWLYRCLVEGLFGLRGERDGLRIVPQLPQAWDEARVTRRFRGALFELHYCRQQGIEQYCIQVDGVDSPEPLIRAIQPGRHYRVRVVLPPSAAGAE